MTRLIDANVLESVILRLNTEENAQITRGEYKLIENVIFEFPTIDAEPVRHGKWIRQTDTRFGEMLNDILICSECNIAFSTVKMIRRSYCPNCGARMDKK